MNATRINDTTWRVIETAGDGSETSHTVALRAENSNAAAAMAIIAALSAPEPVPDAAELLTAARRGMMCSRMQGILALGSVLWALVTAYRDLPETTWTERVIIDSASEWQRNSQNTAFFGYLCGLTDTEIDALFQTAATITA